MQRLIQDPHSHTDDVIASTLLDNILINKPILEERRNKPRPCWNAKTSLTQAAPQKTTKTIFCSHSIYSSCYTSESCHQHFLDINQCQDQRGEEEERLRGRVLLNLTKSNTWIMVVLAAWGHSGGLQASRRHLKFSAVVERSSPHMALISGCMRVFCLSSSKEMPEQLRW